VIGAAWVDPVIAAGAALLGAAIGVVGTIWATLHRDRTERAQARVEAVVDLYAAANGLGHLLLAWHDMRAGVGKGRIADVRLGIRMGGSTNTILARMWFITDEFWRSSARAITVASPDELTVILAVETAVADWEFGRPMPESWAPAIRALRALLTDEQVALHPGSASGMEEIDCQH
jgi:hypothetical protein